MADDNIKVGGVALEITLDDSHIDKDAENAAKKTRKKFSGELAGAGAEADKAFKKSFTGVTGSGSSAAKKIRQSFSTDMRAAGKDVERSLRQSFDNAGSAGSSMADSLVGGLKRAGAAVLALFSVQKLKEFGQSAIEQAAHVTALDSQLTQTFREYEGAAVKAIRRVAEESGILDTRLQGVGTQIYAFAKTSRMDSVTALNMTEDALRVAADSAAYYDRSLEETSETLKSFLKGNYANDAALGVSATETTRNAAAMELYGKSFQNLSEAQKQLTLLQMVKDANALSGAVGQAARESEGWENVIGNLKEAWNQLLAAVGKPILQGAVAVIKQLTEWITKLATWAQAASQALGELFGWDSSPTAQTAADTAQTAGSIAESVDNQNALTQAVAKTNAEVKRGIAGFDKLNIISKSTAQQSENNAEQGIDSGLNGFAGGSALSLDTTDAESQLDKLKNKIIEIFKPFIDAYNQYIKPIVDKVKKKIDEIRKKLKDWWDKLNLGPLLKSIENVLSKLEPLADVLLNQIGWVFENVLLPVGKMFMEKILPTILDLIGNIIGMLTPILDGIGKILKPIIENILMPALDKISEWFQKIGEKIGPRLEDIGGKIGELFEKLQPLIDTLSQILGPVIEAILDVIGGSTMSVLTNVIDTIGSVIDTLSGLIDFISGVFTGDWDKAWSGLSETFRGICNIMIDIINSLWIGIYTVISLIGNAIGGLVEGLGSLFGQEWGWKMPTEAPMIPHIMKESAHGTTHSFASGGIVKAPTLAVVGDNPGAGSGNPEVIAPLNKLQSMINTSNGQDTVILSNILDMLTRIYEMFVIFRSQGGNVYEFAAQLNGNDLFREVVRQNELYKKSHRGRSAF